MTTKPKICMVEEPISLEVSEGLSGAVRRFLQLYFGTHEGMIPPSGLYDLIFRETERPLIEETLRFVDGNQAKASAILGLHRNTLRRKMQALGLEKKA